MNKKMSIKDSIQYLQPIADSASLPRYNEALNVAISAMEEVEFTRQFIHDQGLDFALLNKWEEQRKRVAEAGKTIREEIDHIREVAKMVNQNHIAGDGKKVSGQLQRVYEETLGWVDRCKCCKTIITDTETECPNCGENMNLEAT